MNRVTRPFRLLYVLIVFGLAVSLGFVAPPPAYAAGTIKASATEGIAGETIQISGKLPPELSREVLLQRESDSKWVKVKTRTTDGSGKFTFPMKVRSSTTTYRVYAPAVASDSESAEEIEATNTSSVKVQTLTQKGTLSLASSADFGATVKAKVQFSPARSERVVVLQVKSGSGWKKVTWGRQNSKGATTFTIPTDKKGKRTYRAIAKAHKGAASVATPSKTINVTFDCRGKIDKRKTQKQLSKPFTVCGVPVISKKHRVTAAFKPKLTQVKLPLSGISVAYLEPDTGKALRSLFKAANNAGYKLVIRSPYRSYATQRAIYSPSSTLAAPPGASEHQSGLAVDIAWQSKSGLVRGYNFGSSKAGAWVAKNAHKHGFIVRYPSGQQKITGIPYEPWHLRYVGTTMATGVVKTKTKTLEKYLRVS